MITFRRRRPAESAADPQFDVFYRDLRRHDRRWVVSCRARSVARRCVPSSRALLAVGYCGVFFGGPLPPSVEQLEAYDARTG